MAKMWDLSEKLVCHNYKIADANATVKVVEPEWTPRDATFHTHYIGPNDVPIAAYSKGTVIVQKHCNESSPFSGPIKRVTVKQLGSRAIPTLSKSAKASENVKFNCNMDSVTTLFETVSKLSEVTKVICIIGFGQCDYRGEGRKDVKTPVCPRVEVLKIAMNEDYYHHIFVTHQCQVLGSPEECMRLGCCGHHGVLESLLMFVESLLEHAREGFPNLQALEMHFPVIDRVDEACKSFVEFFGWDYESEDDDEDDEYKI